jgi:alpha-L-arabinofuranosidase
MTGLERNADVVHMSSYAPLFAHVDAWQWAPDLIWFDNLSSYGTPSYYVQKLFAVNKGTQVVPVRQKNFAIEGQDSLYATACIDKKSNELIVKIVNTSPVNRLQEFSVEGVKRLNKKATLMVLENGDLNQVNSLSTPVNISPKEIIIDVPGKKISVSIAPYSLTVLKLKML